MASVNKTIKFLDPAKIGYVEVTIVEGGVTTKKTINFKSVNYETLNTPTYYYGSYGTDMALPTGWEEITNNESSLHEFSPSAGFILETAKPDGTGKFILLYPSELQDPTGYDWDPLNNKWISSECITTGTLSDGQNDYKVLMWSVNTLDLNKLKITIGE